MPETTPSSVSRQDLRAEVPGAKWAYAIELRIGISKRQYTLVEKYRMGWSAWFER